MRAAASNPSMTGMEPSRKITSNAPVCARATEQGDKLAAGKGQGDSIDGAAIVISSENSAVVHTVEAMAKLAGIRILGALGKPVTQAKLQDTIGRAASILAGTEAAPVTRTALKRALAKGAIIPVFQPKFSLEARQISGVEVLARHVGEDGTLGPAHA